MGHGCKAGRYLDERLARLLGRVHWSFNSLTLSSLAVFFLVGEGSLGTVQLHGLFSERTRVCTCVCVCERERESTSLPGTYLPTRTSVPHSPSILPYRQLFSASRHKEKLRPKVFRLVFLADSKLHYPVPKVALHLDALVRGKKREQYLYLGARPH